MSGGLPEALRIAVVSSWPRDPGRGSGTATALHGLERGLEELGHRCTRIEPSGGAGTALAPRLLFNAVHAPRQLASLRDDPPDLVVGIDLDGFLLDPSAPYVVALKGIAADEARHERGIARLRLRVAGALEARNARRADRIVVPSRYAAEAAARMYALPPDRLAVVPEPVLAPDGPVAILDEIPPRHPHPTVLSVARQYPRKRTDVLLRAVPTLVAALPEVRVRIVGDGPELGRLRELASELSVTERVTFLGHVDAARLAREYARAHCFCLPSEQEAYGIAVVEAMAAGLPVVAVRAGALPEVVDHGSTGLLVEPGRPEALGRALREVLSDPGRGRRMGEAGRREARRRGPAEHARSLLEAVPGLRGS